jgi:hypothetical protein
VTTRIEHRCEYLCGARFFGETETRASETRGVVEALAHLPEFAWAFRFYDVRMETWKNLDGVGETRCLAAVVEGSHSGWYYPDAEVFTVAQLEAMPGDFRILIANLRCNDRTGTPRAVRCRLGNYQQLGPDDVVVTPRTL